MAVRKTVGDAMTVELLARDVEMVAGALIATGIVAAIPARILMEAAAAVGPWLELGSRGQGDALTNDFLDGPQRTNKE